MMGDVRSLFYDFVVSKYRSEVWVELCEAMSVPMGGYPEVNTDLFEALSKVMKIKSDDIQELFGAHFVDYAEKNGYHNMFSCLGDSFAEWLSNISTLEILFDHTLELPSCLDGCNSPYLWSVEHASKRGDNDTVSHLNPEISLYYRKVHESLLPAIVIGVIRELGKTYFSTEVQFLSQNIQSMQGATWNCWKILYENDTGIIAEKISPVKTSSDTGTLTSTDISPCLSNRQMKQLFPFCVVFDENMIIIDCGDELQDILSWSPLGKTISESLKVIIGEEGIFDTMSNVCSMYCHSNTYYSEMHCHDGTLLHLKGSISLSDDGRTGFYLCYPNVRTFDDMNNMQLRPRHVSVDSIFQSEVVAFERRKSLKLTEEQEEQAAVVSILRKQYVEQAEKYATQALENKRTFARYISHQIRTPLTVVKLGLQLALKNMKELCASEDVVSNISDCEDSIDVAVAILNDLLVYEKLDSGILEMFKEVVLAVPFISRSIKPFEKQAKEKKITLVIENNCSEDINSLYFYVDKSKMSQVFRNFMSNALKFTAENGVLIVRMSLLQPDKHKKVVDGAPPSTIGSVPNVEERRFMRCISADSLFTMSCGQVPESHTLKSEIDDSEYRLLQNAMVIEFIDSGIGISEENQKKLFKDSIQFNPHVTQEGGGAGLGLWISNGIIKLHDGHVDVRSNPVGQAGVTFSIELPVYKRAVLHQFPDGLPQPCLNRDIPSSSSSEDDSGDVFILTNKPSDLRMEVDSGFLDEKIFLKALVNEKEKLLAPKFQKKEHLEKETVICHDNHVEEKKGMVVDINPDKSEENVVKGPLFGARVLIIDDSKLILRVTSKTLLELGVKCDTALDGEKGINKIKEAANLKDTSNTDMVSQSLQDCNYYDLVMLDKEMPVMDGLQTCLTLRQLGYKGVIVGVTGSCMPSEIEEFRKVGIDEVFAKPLDIHHLESYFLNMRRCMDV